MRDPASVQSQAPWTPAEPARVGRPLPGGPVSEDRAPSAIHAFLGGSPLAVLVRLALVSILVGAVLLWLDIRPEDIIDSVERTFNRVWSMGFESVRQVGRYLVAGAVIVIPLWLVMRVFSYRGR